MKNDHDLLDGLIRAYRYSGNRLVIQESVSDHVWCMISLALEYEPIMREKFDSVRYDLKDIIYAIVLHDLDESITGDVPRNFKHYNEEIETAISKTVDTIMSTHCSEKVYSDWKFTADKTEPLSFLVKIFDVAQAGYKMISEIELGNHYFKQEMCNVIDYLSGMIPKLEQYNFHQKVQEAYKWLINNFIEKFIGYSNYN